jgi:hypothetical protein
MLPRQRGTKYLFIVSLRILSLDQLAHILIFDTPAIHVASLLVLPSLILFIMFFNR